MVHQQYQLVGNTKDSARPTPRLILVLRVKISIFFVQIMAIRNDAASDARISINFSDFGAIIRTCTLNHDSLE
jgi:hypothetical protein